MNEGRLPTPHDVQRHALVVRGHSEGVLREGALVTLALWIETGSFYLSERNNSGWVVYSANDTDVCKYPFVWDNDRFRIIDDAQSSEHQA